MTEEDARKPMGDRLLVYVVFLVAALSMGVFASPLFPLVRRTFDVGYVNTLLILVLIPAAAVWFVASGLCVHRRTLLYSRASVGGVAGLLVGMGVVAASYVLIFGITLYVVPAGLAALLAKLQHDRDLRKARAVATEKESRPADVRTGPMRVKAIATLLGLVALLALFTNGISLVTGLSAVPQIFLILLATTLAVAVAEIIIVPYLFRLENWVWRGAVIVIVFGLGLSVVEIAWAVASAAQGTVLLGRIPLGFLSVVLAVAILTIPVVHAMVLAWLLLPQVRSAFVSQ